MAGSGRGKRARTALAVSAALAVPLIGAACSSAQTAPTTTRPSALMSCEDSLATWSGKFARATVTDDNMTGVAVQAVETLGSPMGHEAVDLGATFARGLLTPGSHGDLLGDIDSWCHQYVNPSSTTTTTLPSGTVVAPSPSTSTTTTSTVASASAPSGLTAAILATTNAMSVQLDGPTYPPSSFNITATVATGYPAWAGFTVTPVGDTNQSLSGIGLAHLVDGKWAVVVGPTRETCDAKSEWQSAPASVITQFDIDAGC